MDNLTLVVVAFCVYMVSAAFSLSAARSKGRSPAGWFMLGLIFGPLAFILVLVLGETPASAESKRLARGEIRKCKHCAEFIKAEATLCKHCAQPQ